MEPINRRTTHVQLTDTIFSICQSESFSIQIYQTDISYQVKEKVSGDSAAFLYARTLRTKYSRPLASQTDMMLLMC